MIEVKDRVPTKPGRVKFTFDDGTVKYATMERADEPVETGTPINKVLFESIKKDIIDYSNRFFTPAWKDENINIDVTSDNPVILYSDKTNGSYTTMEFPFGIKIEELRMAGYTSTGTSFRLKASEDGVNYEEIASGNIYYGSADATKYTFQISSQKVYRFLEMFYSGAGKTLAITLSKGTLYDLPKFILDCSDYVCGEGKKHFFVYFPELIMDISNIINKYYGQEANATGVLISNNDAFIESLKKYYIEFEDKTKAIQDSSTIILNNCYFLYQKEEDLIPIIMQ